MNKQTQLRYLKRLRVFVAAFKAWRPTKTDRFDFRYWHKETGCGTACSAWGLAPSIPSFRRAGVVVTEQVFGRNVSLRLRRGYDEFLHGTEAAAEFLGLTAEEANVFLPYPYRKTRRSRTPRALARNPIRKSEVTAQLNALLRKKEREFTKAHGGAA